MRLLRHMIRLVLLSLVSTGVMYGVQNADSRIPVVLSTDVGNEIDDQWAITYLLLQPRFDVLGVISAHVIGQSSGSLMLTTSVCGLTS